MIAATIFLLAQVKPAVPELVEYPDQTKAKVYIEAIVDLPPKLNASQRYVLTRSLGLATHMTQEYGKRDVFNILASGTRFHLYHGADHLRIGLAVDPDRLGSGLALLNSLFTVPTYLPETIKDFKLAFEDPWSPAYEGYAEQSAPLDHDTMLSIWLAVVRPNRVSVAVSGNFAPGEAKSKWSTAQRNWQTVPDRLPIPFPPKATPKENSIPLILFDSRPIAFTAENIGAYFLAANCLGVGKESILWKVARDGMSLSYRQEAFMLPTEEGWKFRMAFATDGGQAKPETITALRANIRTLCAALTEDDLAHAVGLARGYLENNLPQFPIVAGVSPAVDVDPNDSLYLQHYWQHRFGFSWTSATLYQKIKGTKLDDVKKLLLKIVDESNVRLL